MPDVPLAGPTGGSYDPNMEARIARLEEDMRDVKATTSRLEMALVRIESILTATLPHLATKAELNELRGDMIAGLAPISNLATKAELNELRGEMIAGLAPISNVATKAELNELRSEVVAGLAPIPHLATKAELAEKPSKTYMWGILAVLLTAYACGLAALAILK